MPLQGVRNITSAERDYPDRSCSTTAHHVQPGDTFFSIADRYIVSFDDLLQANEGRGIDFTTLHRGQTLKIPKTHGPRSIYTVREGDDLWNMAQLTGVPMSIILADSPQAEQLTAGSCLSLRTHPSYHVAFKHEQNQISSDLPLHWQEDARFKQMLAMQCDVLSPKGKGVFKYPSAGTPRVCCDCRTTVTGSGYSVFCYAVPPRTCVHPASEAVALHLCKLAAGKDLQIVELVYMCCCPCGKEQSQQHPLYSAIT